MLSRVAVENGTLLLIGACAIAGGAAGWLIANRALARKLRPAIPPAPPTPPTPPAQPQPPSAPPPMSDAEEVASALIRHTASAREEWLRSLDGRCPSCSAEITRSESNVTMVETTSGGFRSYDEHLRCGSCGFSLDRHGGAPANGGVIGRWLDAPDGPRRVVVIGDDGGPFVHVFAGGQESAIGVSVGETTPAHNAFARLATVLVARAFQVDAAPFTVEEADAQRRIAIDRLLLGGRTLEVRRANPGEEPAFHALAGTGPLPTAIPHTSRSSRYTAPLPVPILASPAPPSLPFGVGIETVRGPKIVFAAGAPLPQRAEVSVPLDPRRVCVTARVFAAPPRRALFSLWISLPTTGASSVKLELELSREGLLSASPAKGVEARLGANNIEPPL